MNIGKIILIVSILCPGYVCNAQFDMSSINSCVSLDTNYFNRQNPGAISPAANQFYSELSLNPYMHQMDGLNSGSAVISHGIGKFSAAITLDGINSKDYAETVARGIINYKIYNAVVGASINYSNISVTQFGAQNKIDLSFGCSLSIYEHLIAGFAFQNALGTQYTELKNSYSRKAMFGLAWQPLNSLSIEASGFVRIDYFGGAIVKMIYNINDLVSVAGAVCTNPSVASIETSMNIYKNIRLKLSAINHETLGWSPSLALGFLF